MRGQLHAIDPALLVKSGPARVAAREVHVVDALNLFTALLRLDGLQVVGDVSEHGLRERSVGPSEDVSVGNGHGRVHSNEKVGRAEGSVPRVLSIVLVPVDHIRDRVRVRRCRVLADEDVVGAPRLDVGRQDAVVGVHHHLVVVVLEATQESGNLGRQAGLEASQGVVSLRRKHYLVEPFEAAQGVDVHAVHAGGDGRLGV